MTLNSINRKKNPKFPRFRLWTFPVIIDGPFGVVSAAELIGILLFAAYVLWNTVAYVIQTHNMISGYSLPSKEKRYVMFKPGNRFTSSNCTKNNPS